MPDAQLLLSLPRVRITEFCQLASVLDAFDGNAGWKLASWGQNGLSGARLELPHSRQRRSKRRQSTQAKKENPRCRLKPNSTFPRPILPRPAATLVFGKFSSRSLVDLRGAHLPGDSSINIRNSYCGRTGSNNQAPRRRRGHRRRGTAIHNRQRPRH